MADKKKKILALWNKNPSGETVFRQNLLLKHGIEISKSELHKILLTEPNFIRGITSKRRIKRRSFLQPRIGDIFEADLGHFVQDNGYKFCLLIIDVGSRYDAGDKSPF